MPSKIIPPPIPIIADIADVKRDATIRYKYSIKIFPLIFGPFFAHVAIERGLEFGIIMATIYSLVLTILDNIQEDLEDPFDGVGSDDIQLNYPTMLQVNTVKP